jgi:hypothetical protein
MRTRVSLELLDESRRFELRWACEHCAHFDARADACSNGWPTRDHRERGLREGGEIAFCKEFEG